MATPLLYLKLQQLIGISVSVEIKTKTKLFSATYLHNSSMKIYTSKFFTLSRSKLVSKSLIKLLKNCDFHFFEVTFNTSSNRKAEILIRTRLLQCMLNGMLRCLLSVKSFCFHYKFAGKQYLIKIFMATSGQQ